MSRTQGFTFHGTGTLARIDLFHTKGGKVIKTLVLEVADDRFPQMVPVKVFGQLAERVYHPGDVMSVSGRYGGKDWNGKCFGDATAQTIEVIGRDEQPQGKQLDVPGTGPGRGDDDVPF